MVINVLTKTLLPSGIDLRRNVSVCTLAPMKKKPGRPPKAAGHRKADLLQIRLEKVETETFQKAAEIAGIPLSAWARERLRRIAVKELEQVGLRAPILADLYPKA